MNVEDREFSLAIERKPLQTLRNDLVAFCHNDRHHFLIHLVNCMIENKPYSLLSSHKVPVNHNEFEWLLSLCNDTLLIGNLIVRGGQMWSEGPLLSVSTGRDAIEGLSVIPEHSPYCIEVDSLSARELSVFDLKQGYEYDRLEVFGGRLIFKQDWTRIIIADLSKMNLPNPELVNEVVGAVAVAYHLGAQINEITNALVAFTKLTNSSNWYWDRHWQTLVGECIS
jgi:hypothetical protein